MKYVKYVKSLICILLVCVLLSGCSFRFASSIDELISPVSPFGENADIQKAMQKYYPNGYTLKNPSEGEFVTSYSFFDIDSDGQDEAFAFFEPSDNLGTVNMAVLDKIDNTWSVVECIKGEGKDVYSIAFNDVNGNGKPELVVCWDVLSNSTNHQLVVYSINYEKNYSVKTVCEAITVNNYTFVDMNNDGVDEILLFVINTGSTVGAKADLYSLKNNEKTLLGTTKLDSHITAYTNILVENINDDVRVYADAIGSDGHSMLTEVVYWSDYYNTIISPFYNYSSGRTSSTSRNTIIESADINGDGVILIPTDVKLNTLPKQVSAVDWKCYKSSTVVHSNYSLYVQQDGYYVTVSDKFFNKLSVKYNADKREMTVYNSTNNSKVFSVVSILKADYDEEKYKDYTVALESSGYKYLVQTGTDKDIQITVDDLKQCLKSVN